MPGLVPNVPVPFITPSTTCAADADIVGTPGVWKRPDRFRLNKFRLNKFRAYLKILLFGRIGVDTTHSNQTGGDHIVSQKATLHK